MKIFDDMTFSGRPEALGRFIEMLAQSPQIGPWRRDPEAEQAYAGSGHPRFSYRCFRKNGHQEIPSALLWMFPGERGTSLRNLSGQPTSTWRVSNIVPSVQNAAFSEETYYSLLMSFREATLPLAGELGVSISVPKLDVGPEYWLTPKQESLLRFFSSNANRSTGAGHPSDRKRWNAFVIAVHHDGSRVGGSDIERILVEHEHWPERIAQELAIDFDKHIDLLRDSAKSA